MNIKRFIAVAIVAMAFTAFTPTVGRAGVMFSFNQVGSSVVMTSSGTANLNNLVLDGTDGWSGTGFGDFSGYSLLGGTSFGGNDTTYVFHAGTDLSPWASSAGIFGGSGSNFSPNVITGTKSFATYAYNPNLLPGLSFSSSDIVGSTWSPDQEWTWNGATLASLGLQVGTYTISDAVSGETMTLQIGAVPEPASFAIFGTICFLGFGRRRKS